MTSAAPQVLISEVGPRDGLQSVRRTMATADKLRWISALAASGLREIEVASFVPARLLPQMADAAEVVKHALTYPQWSVMALVPNLRGARAALAAGVHKLTIPVSASAAHSLANVRKTRQDMLLEVRHPARAARPGDDKAQSARTRWRVIASGDGGDPRSQLLALIGNAACDRDAQCHTVAIGSPPGVSDTDSYLRHLVGFGYGGNEIIFERN